MPVPRPTSDPLFPRFRYESFSSDTGVFLLAGRLCPSVSCTYTQVHTCTARCIGARVCARCKWDLCTCLHCDFSMTQPRMLLSTYSYSKSLSVYAAGDPHVYWVVCKTVDVDRRNGGRKEFKVRELE